MHPYETKSLLKDFIHNNNVFIIFISFISFYFLMSFIFSFFYFNMIENLSYKTIIKESIYLSFGFDFISLMRIGDDIYIVKLFHEISSFLLSTIFTAAIILKFFFNPIFFKFKTKCNLYEKDNKRLLSISLYSQSKLFVTNCTFRVYARMNYIDKDNNKSLLNINNSEVLYLKTFPFMEKHLVTRLFIEVDEFKEFKGFLNDQSTNNSLDLIIMIDANVSQLDKTIHEVYKYTLSSKELNKSIDNKIHNGIELDYDDYTKSKGWESFDK